MEFILRRININWCIKKGRKLFSHVLGQNCLSNIYFVKSNVHHFVESLVVSLLLCIRQRKT